MVGRPTRRARSPPTSAYPRATVMLTRSGRSCTGSGRIHCPQPDAVVRRLIPWRASAQAECGSGPAVCKEIPVRHLTVVSVATLLLLAAWQAPARTKSTELQTDLNIFMKEV